MLTFRSVECYLFIRSNVDFFAGDENHFNHKTTLGAGHFGNVTHRVIGSVEKGYLRSASKTPIVSLDLNFAIVTPL